VFTSGGLTSQEASGEGFEAEAFGQVFRIGSNEHWKTTLTGVQRLLKSERLFVEGKNLRFSRYLDDFPIFPLTNVWTDVGGVQSRTDPKIYVVQTGTNIRHFQSL
jgi:adenine-specific DNA-methyltransferase